MEWLSPQEKFWKAWNANTELEQQKKRIKKSFDDECQPFYISPFSLSGTFGCSEGTFICSLDDDFCNCDEHIYDIHFDGDDVPCRFMYRLAYELGITNSDGKLKEKAESAPLTDKEQYDYFADCLEVIEKYDDITQNALRILLRRSSRKRYYDKQYKVFTANVHEVQMFINDGVLDVVNDSLILLDNQRKLVRKMDDIGFVFPENLERTKQGKIKVKAKYEWCLQHPDVVAVHAYPDKVALALSAKMQVVAEWVCDYLTRKFCDTICKISFHDGGSQEIRHPTGAEITDSRKGTFAFPDDVITTALDYYGHNRCKNYTEALEVHTSHMSLFTFTFSPDEQL